ncbi:MAG: type II toxin-antitoxin system HicB family antitoxin [bacterium]
MMEYKGYLARVEFDDHANVFHGEVVNIRDVITFQGTSVDELQQAFKDSVDDYLDFCKERGEEPEKPFSGRFMIHISPEQHRRMLLAAEKSGKDLNAWVSEVLDQASAV